MLPVAIALWGGRARSPGSCDEHHKLSYVNPPSFRLEISQRFYNIHYLLLCLLFCLKTYDVH